jgi:cell wall-associated NlpC family hydrolase
LLLALCTAACAGAAVAPGTAHAGKIAEKRAEAARVEAQLNALYAKVDAAVEAYDKARSKLHHVRVQIAQNTQRLHLARHNLRVAQRQLAGMLVRGYKDGEPDVAVYVLGAQSFTDLVDRLDLVQRTSRQQAAVLAQIMRAEHAIAVHQRALKREQKRAVKLVARTTAKKREAKALVAHQQAVLDGLKHDIAVLIKQAQERRDRIARQKAEAAARARAAAEAAARQARANPPSDTGGSGSATPQPPPPVPVPPPSGSLGQQAVAIAMQELGVPYVWGGASPSGFDCSGLTMWVYAQLGIQLDHYTGSQWQAGPHVPYDALEPGDLVFFEPDIGHVGIYIGNGLFIHAPHTGDVVRISSLSGWYAAEYQGAVRLTG